MEVSALLGAGSATGTLIETRRGLTFVVRFDPSEQVFVGEGPLPQIGLVKIAQPVTVRSIQSSFEGAIDDILIQLSENGW